MVCTHSDQNFMRGTRIEGQLVCESVGKPHSVADARESYRGGWSCGAVVKQEHSASPGPRLRTMRRQMGERLINHQVSFGAADFDVLQAFCSCGQARNKGGSGRHPEH